jgi:hypothetical protein
VQAFFYSRKLLLIKSRGTKMYKKESCRGNSYVDLSVEALWVARVIQDGLDVLLGSPSVNAWLDANGVKRLSMQRDVFERLGVYGCSGERLNPACGAWTAASRTELIRQLAVHWRAFMAASSGRKWASELILSLTAYEISILEQVLKCERHLKAHADEVVLCMKQELDTRSRPQNAR